MKYRNKPVIIEAEQFLLKGQHPSLGDPIEIKVPVGVIKKQLSDYQDPKPYFKYGVETWVGFQECTSGDYIVTGSNGEKHVIKMSTFESTYEVV